MCSTLLVHVHTRTEQLYDIWERQLFHRLGLCDELVATHAALLNVSELLYVSVYSTVYE